MNKSTSSNQIKAQVLPLVNSLYESFGLQPSRRQVSSTGCASGAQTSKQPRPREGNLRSFFDATDLNKEGLRGGLVAFGSRCSKQHLLIMFPVQKRRTACSQRKSLKGVQLVLSYCIGVRCVMLSIARFFECFLRYAFFDVAWASRQWRNRTQARFHCYRDMALREKSRECEFKRQVGWLENQSTGWPTKSLWTLHSVAASAAQQGASYDAH